MRAERTRIRERKSSIRDDGSVGTSSLESAGSSSLDSKASEIADSNRGIAKRLSGVGSTAHLDAKALTDAFLDLEVICGVHKPIAGSDSVDLAVRASRRADILVVDWYLEKQSSAKAKAIVAGVLEFDVKEYGRLRLIAVYTSEHGLKEVVEELYEELERRDGLKGRFKLDGFNICSSDSRICVFNKTFGGLEGGRVVPENQLPQRLLAEFIELSNGLLANFAVSAIASIRRGAHHVLSRFHSSLDGAYLLHRILQCNPSEAEDLALERIAAELSCLMENANVAASSLQAPVIKSWIEDREKNGKLKFPNNGVLINSTSMYELSKVGLQAWKKAEKEARNGVSVKRLMDIFYPAESDARTSNQDFSRLTTFKREFGRIRQDDFRPRLSLGSLVKVRSDLGDSSLYMGLSDFLVCVQPRCDSVRIEESRAFPFQIARHNSEKFNIVVDGVGSKAYLLAEFKPMNTIMLTFSPRDGEGSIFAFKQDGQYLFKDECGRCFQWVGDIDDLKAQRIASEIGAQMHRVGVSDFEWLRLGSKGDVKPEK